MLTQDFATASSRRFLTGVSYADLDHDNFYSIGEGRNGMTIAVGGSSTSHRAAGGYSLQVGTGVQNVTFSGGGLSAPISLAVTVLGEHQCQGRRRRSECRLHLGLAHRSRRRGDDHRAWHHRPFADRRRRQRHDLRHQGKRHAERRPNGTDTAVFSGARAAYTITQHHRRIPDHRAGWHRPVVQYRERAVRRSDDLARRTANAATAASALDGEHRYRDASARISDLRHR